MPDAGVPDGGMIDGGVRDGGVRDGGVRDGGVRDASAIDAGPPEGRVVGSGLRCAASHGRGSSAPLALLSLLALGWALRRRR
jgi:uncharacterized protein (TIGR03382 family)